MTWNGLNHASFLSWLADCLFWDNQEGGTRNYLWYPNDQTEYVSNPIGTKTKTTGATPTTTTTKNGRTARSKFLPANSLPTFNHTS